MTTRNQVIGAILLVVLALTASKLRWDAELAERARAVRDSRPAPTAQGVQPVPPATSDPLLQSGDEGAIVARVFDGDSVQLDTGHGLRYIGIDAPEAQHDRRTAKCFADEATARNRELVEGNTVRLEQDVSNTDRYGRLLRYVYVGDTFVNETLVREGYARARAYPPDTEYQAVLRAAETEARAARRGLWGTACGP